MKNDVISASARPSRVSVIAAAQTPAKQKPSSNTVSADPRAMAALRKHEWVPEEAEGFQDQLWSVERWNRRLEYEDPPKCIQRNLRSTTLAISLQSHTLNAEPFLIIGVIAGIRRFHNMLVELGLLAATVVALAGAIWIFRYSAYKYVKAQHD
jgi:hypothetical protein